MKILENISVKIILALSVTVLLGYAAAVDGQPPVGQLSPEVITAQAGKARDPEFVPLYPQIKKFSLTPGVWILGGKGDITFRWDVEPGPGGIPLKSVAIARTSGEGPEVSYSGPEGRGQYIYNSSSTFPEGVTLYTFTATNEKGVKSTRTVEFKAKSITSARKGITLVSISTQPEEISEGVPFTLIVQLKNLSGLSISGVNFPLEGRDFASMDGHRAFGSPPPATPVNQGGLNAQVIRPGMNTYRITCAPGVPVGRADGYVLDIKSEYEGETIVSIWLRPELSRTASGMKYYNLRYGSKVFEK